MDVLISTLLDVAIHVSRFTKKKDTHGEETAWRYRRVLVFKAGGSSSVSLSLSLSLSVDIARPAFNRDFHSLRTESRHSESLRNYKWWCVAQCAS